MPIQYQITDTIALTSTYVKSETDLLTDVKVNAMARTVTGCFGHLKMSYTENHGWAVQSGSYWSPCDVTPDLPRPMEYRRALNASSWYEPRAIRQVDDATLLAFCRTTDESLIPKIRRAAERAARMAAQHHGTPKTTQLDEIHAENLFVEWAYGLGINEESTTFWELNHAFRFGVFMHIYEGRLPEGLR